MPTKMFEVSLGPAVGIAWNVVLFFVPLNQSSLFAATPINVASVASV